MVRYQKAKLILRHRDLFMSLIHTCELNGINHHDYLTQLLQRPNELAAHPADWMPWNYQETLQRPATPQAGRSRSLAQRPPSEIHRFFRLAERTR